MYNYVVLGRKGSIVRFVFKSDPPAKPRALDLAGFVERNPRRLQKKAKRHRRLNRLSSLLNV